MHKYKQEIEAALENAWNVDLARTNLERWLELCEKESWGKCPENITLLIKLFGASWAFTRLVFFQGNQIADYFDNPVPSGYSIDDLYDLLVKEISGTKLDEHLDNLRISKNKIMLQILLGYLDDRIDQENLEISLSNLAETTLRCILQILDQDTHHDTWNQIAILAMGRLAGHEMNFGSDLDLIILFPEDSRSESEIIFRQAQLMMRHIAEVSPNGMLYEVDMRLRPHGSSGTLVSSAQYFIDYHNDKERAVWERQMMTRCRDIIDNNNLAKESLQAIHDAIYSEYSDDMLKSEIIEMRSKVQEDLGSPRDKYEIKRGKGGIMDIDFITHYLQLLHGKSHQGLQTASTRQALRKLRESKLLKDNDCQELLDGYDFLKKVEGVIRLFDMKSISAFSKKPEDISPLARAAGFIETDPILASERFLEHYLDVTNKVRQKFTEIVGEID